MTHYISRENITFSEAIRICVRSSYLLSFMDIFASEATATWHFTNFVFCIVLKSTAYFSDPDCTVYTCVHIHICVYTRTHPLNGPLSGTTRVGRYQKGKTNLDFTEARDSEWQWYQLGRMQVCT